MKLLLVSDLDHYATKNVFEDYLVAFQRIGVDVTPFRMFSLMQLLSQKVMYNCLFSDIMYKCNGFTHVLFVTGTNVPPDLIDSIAPHIKVCVIGTDDPHSSKHVMSAFNSHLDYYFTNEKKMSNYDSRFHYIPIATSSTIPTDVTMDHLSDVCFVGSVYPSRLPALERVMKWCMENDKKPLFVGPQRDVPSDSIIKPVSKEIIINNIESMKYMAGAKVSINLDRDVNWFCGASGGSNYNLLDVGVPYSTNPRTYEVPLNKSIQLFINPRQEAIDVFGDSIFIADDESIEETLKNIFDTPKADLEEIKAKAFAIAQINTYESRAQAIFKILNKE